MSPLEQRDSAGTLEKDNETQQSSSDLVRRMNAVKNEYRGYFHITFNELHVASQKETTELAGWALNMKLDEKEIAEREEWYESDYKKRIISARSLHKTFFQNIEEAAGKRLINEQSKQNWIKRFQDPNVGYKQREYWVMHQMPHYFEAWAKAAEDRKTLLADPRFKDLLSRDPSFASIKDENAFLGLHFEKRKGLLAAARAAILATEKNQIDLYATANAKLSGAVTKKILAAGKVGMWLERIFKSNADPKKIEEFVNGKGANSLADLMSNWSDVRKRYDLAKGKVGALKEESMPRGLHLLSESQFLSLHYAQRLRYVEELEHRLNDSPDPNNEQPIFLEIRHAIDSKDWLEAEMLMGIAKNKGLSEQEKGRLESMRRFVKQFKPKQEAAGSAEKVTEAKHKMDELVKQVPSSMQPMILRLLKGPNAIRSIHQFRWIMYNNKWCRSHGYLNEDIARKGASDDNAALTKHRAEHGQDVGRHDVLTHDTADKEYMRKKEYATHKATYLHTNVKSGGVTSTLAEWLEHEQNPKQLYWTTFCAHEDGDPKSEIWHNDLFAILTEMRSLSRTISGAGFTYMGTHAQLASKH